jgi:hypothetical protein
VYLRARWYAPGQGRFVSEDPFAGWAELPYSLHAYQYAYSNPVRFTDPTGMRGSCPDYIYDPDDFFVPLFPFPCSAYFATQEEAIDFRDNVLGIGSDGNARPGGTLEQLKHVRFQEQLTLAGGVIAASAVTIWAAAAKVITGSVATAMGIVDTGAGVSVGFQDQLGIDPNGTLDAIRTIEWMATEITDFDEALQRSGSTYGPTSALDWTPYIVFWVDFVTEHSAMMSYQVLPEGAGQCPEIDIDYLHIKYITYQRFGGIGH